MSCVIGKSIFTAEEILQCMRQDPLVALRKLLTDEMIYQACRKARYEYRDRLLGPVPTVFHFLLQAVQREESFAATTPTLGVRWAAAFGLTNKLFSSSATSQARSRLPQSVLQLLVKDVCNVEPQRSFEYWQGMRLLALDCATVSMPAEKELFDHFGRPRARKAIMRYPLGTLATLLAVGTSLILAHRFGPYDRGEFKTSLPLIAQLKKGDLLLADRHYSGSPTLARLLAREIHFVMRKNARLLVERLPIIKRLGRNDFITEIPMDKAARQADPSLPEKVRVRIFKARWVEPGGERVEGWFVTSLRDACRYKPAKLAKLYHERWEIETSYRDFKVTFHSDVLRSKTVDNIEKELLAHVLAYQLVRHVMVQAAQKHHLKPTGLSFLNATRWVLVFSCLMQNAPTTALPQLYEHLLDVVASEQIDVRPGRHEPRAIVRECKHYLYLCIPRQLWRERRAKGLPEIFRLSKRH